MIEFFMDCISIGENRNMQIPIADIHCHILPGVDDGSRSMEQTISMLNIAYDQGVRRIIATPHFHIGKVQVTKEKAEEALINLRTIFEKQFPELSVYIGSEIYYYSDAIRELDAGRAMTMAGSRYVMWEFNPDEQFDDIGNSVYDAVSNGYVPIIAHAERYICLMDRPELYEQLVREGAYIQVNAGSVAGAMGRSVQKFIIKKLLKKRLVHFVASDAHSDGRRSPRFEDAVRTLMKHCDADYCMDLLWNNANKVINNEEI